MKKMLYVIALLSLLTSCVNDDMLLPGNGQEGEPVEVTLSLDISAEQQATPDFSSSRPCNANSRSIDDPDNGVETEIANVWVVQFSGTEDNAVLIGHPAYIEDFRSNKNVKLIASSKPNTLVFFANTFNPDIVFPQGSTLGDIKARIKEINEQSDLFGLSGSKIPGANFPDNGDYYIMLNGSTQVTLQNSGEIVTCELKRNVARIDFNIKVKENLDVVIENVELHSVPARSCYFTASLPDIFPTGSFQTVDFDTAAAVFDESDKSKTYRFYMPVNQRGSVNNSAEAVKGQFAPDNSTYVYVKAHYTENGAEIPIYYTFYLGANLLNDFNIKPNHKYSYNVTINARGDSSTDMRVSDWGPVDFSDNQLERSNCYILNPAPVSGYARRFRMPVDRVDTFWGGHGYENNPSYTLSEGNKPWRMEIIWADFDYESMGVTMTKDKGAGSRDYFEVAVPGFVSGNMVVGIKLDAADSPILWSWHLWITDYNPDEVERVSPQAGRYVYQVSGGVIHRYSGNSWAVGKHNKFIMDRNVGALSNGYSQPGDRGVLYYQFGRKDPVPGDIKLYGPGNPSVKITKYSDTGTENYDNMIYSINHPLTFITSGNGSWSNGKYFEPQYVWNDPMLDKIISADVPLSKSIFDPSPLGWCLPKSEVVEDFRDNGKEYPTTNILRNASATLLRGFTPYDDPAAKGLRYWPYPASGDVTVTDEVYYPAVGTRYGSSGYIAFPNDIYLWGCDRYNRSQAYTIFHARSSLLNINAQVGGAYGFPVRCVQHSRYKK